MNSNIATKKLGILGGGQLGRMFLQEAINFNIYTHVLDADAQAPCKNLCNEFTQGSLMDYETVYQFGKKVDILTIEIEHVNVDALEQLEKEGVAIYPQPKVLKTIQDKGLQKLFYKNNRIPTADFYLIENKNNLLSYQHLFPMVLKTRKGGYDGKGVKILRNAGDLQNAFDQQCILESLIPFEKETAVIVARNVSGETAVYPMVDMEFNPEANLVEFLYAPTSYSNDIESKAQQIAIKIVNELGLVGLLAVEFFITANGEIYVNEVAPRTHNSGHQTIEANYTSQFEQHLRAIFNLSLGSTDLIQPAVMINLLGANNYEGATTFENLNCITSTTGAYLHLYGKNSCKPYRKMGHVTVINPDLKKAITLAKFIKEQFIIRGENVSK